MCVGSIIGGVEVSGRWLDPLSLDLPLLGISHPDLRRSFLSKLMIRIVRT
ncbi:hypothetical protein Psta_1480 [Pirellula staleyi DSM 6068]|uniref:Uncharacterized protein n=1 Tax=Pirellula staleyi (strain ATCC 27377 / DSM 6068 / ICPB 4128) TaxID=530564 RepID=D2QXH0_PIRSD|nr:hypothetical protein Psta_1480 [Pirellula staleyi DSM 6068]